MATPTTQLRRSRSNRSRARRLAPWIAGTVSLLLLITTLSIGWRVRESMRRVNRTSIETIRNANVAVMELWMDERCNDVEVCVENETIEQSAVELLNRWNDRKPVDAQLPRSAEQAEHAQRLAKIYFDRKDYLGWILIDSQGSVVSSDHPDLIGIVFPIADDVRDQLDRSITTVTRPFATPAKLSHSRGEVKVDAPLMLAIAPVREGVRSIGGIALLIDPMDRFCNLLQAAQIGQSCETIAFDRHGVFITRSRFEQQLQAAGRLPKKITGSSVLNVHARVPQDDTSVHPLGQSVASLPLTFAADQATRGATGSNLVGYKDYRGVNVIGTWYWVPRYNFAVMTKMDYEEAYGPMRVLRNAFYLLFAIVGLTCLGLFVLVWIIRRFSIDSRPRRKLGQYDLKEAIGIGGMGKVFLGRHESLQRDVAVKVLEGSAVNSLSFSRFEREVRMTAKLRHPNTVEIYDYGRTDDGTFFYVMEYVEGISLAQLIDQYGRQSAPRVISILLQICGSLAEAHLKGLVHRDIKPANVLLSSQQGIYDLVKVLDFGLVKEMYHDASNLTQIASITGTPMYMSPEAVRNASLADQRSDIYAVGAVGYQLLCGWPLFSGENAADIYAKQLHEMPVRPIERLRLNSSPATDVDEANFPDDLQNILMHCLDKDPIKRPQSMSELASALSQCQNAYGWSSEDAQQWWELAANTTSESPRDVATHFADNAPATP
ncbi:MAG: serine/threonine-protein kinase [Pirellulaceae bacterium]